MKRLLIWSITLATALSGAQALAEEEPAKPSVDTVMEQLATVGAEALLARIGEMRAQVDKLTAEATELRGKAEQLEAQSATLRQQIAAVEQFATNLATAMQPKEAPAAEQPAAEPEPAPPAAEQVAEASPAEPEPAGEEPAAEAPAETGENANPEG